MIARLFHLSERALHAALRFISLSHQGIWLGILGPRHLDQLTEAYYDRKARYVDPDYNASGLLPWERELIGAHFRPGARLLVAAAGGGREVLALNKAGYPADGFDCNPRLITAARELLRSHDLAARMMIAPPGAAPEGLGIYDGIIIGWGGYMHIPTRHRRRALLVSLTERLAPGGLLLVSAFHQAERGRGQRAVVKVANILRWLRRAEAAEPGDWLCGSFDHHFTREELIAELTEAALDVLELRLTGDGYCVALARQRAALPQVVASRAAAAA